MEEIDKKTLKEHTQALNRVADALDDLLDGLPGFVQQLERNETLLQAQYDRAKTRGQILDDIDKYEKKRSADEKKGKKKERKKRVHHPSTGAKRG